MSDHKIIITNSGRWEDHVWRTEIDLDQLVESAGKKVKIHGSYFTDYPIYHAKRVLKLIREYGTTDDWCTVDEVLKKHPRLYGYWKELMAE